MAPRSRYSDEDDEDSSFRSSTLTCCSGCATFVLLIMGISLLNMSVSASDSEEGGGSGVGFLVSGICCLLGTVAFFILTLARFNRGKKNANRHHYYQQHPYHRMPPPPSSLTGPYATTTVEEYPL